MFIILHLLYFIPFLIAFSVAIFQKNDSLSIYIYKAIIVILSIPQYLVSLIIVSVILKKYDISSLYTIALIQTIVLIFQVYVSYKLIDIVKFCLFIIKEIYMRIK